MKTSEFNCRWVALGDTHCPFQDDGAITTICDFIRDYQPQVVVHVGDGVEGGAASKHNNEYKHDLKDEYDAFNDVLARLRSAAPAAQLVFMEGNHDANILAEGRIAPDIRRIVAPELHVPEMVHWQIYPYSNNRRLGVFRLGPISFAHGYSSTRTAGRDESIRFAPSNGLYVHGHTHRPHPPEQARYGTKNVIDRWYMNLGTLGPLDPPYTRRLNSDEWGHAFGWGSCNDRRNLYASRQWEAHLETL